MFESKTASGKTLPLLEEEAGIGGNGITLNSRKTFLETSGTERHFREQEKSTITNKSLRYLACVNC